MLVADVDLPTPPLLLVSTIERVMIEVSSATELSERNRPRNQRTANPCYASGRECR
jgi:hypothetical protein